MRLRTLILTTLLAVTVAGCGVKGPLVPPSAANAPEAPEGSELEEAAPQDDRSFVLDGLLL
ncbi:MAG: lipoprotein [Hyphomicrobiales bacterium]|jgi:predicted small lipoprotein YifL